MTERQPDEPEYPEGRTDVPVYDPETREWHYPTHRPERVGDRDHSEQIIFTRMKQEVEKKE